jgi:hypothetical protein
MSNSTLFQEKAGADIYWAEKGKHQAELNRINALVPDSGPAETLEGELLRSVTRLYYDYYNNGMCNNTSGAVNFLIKYNGKIGLGIGKELDAVYESSVSGGYGYVNLEVELEKIVDSVIVYIASVKDYTVNTENLFDFSDDTVYEDEDDDDDYFDQYDQYDDEDEE